MAVTSTTTNPYGFYGAIAETQSAPKAAEEAEAAAQVATEQADISSNAAIESSISADSASTDADEAAASALLAATVTPNLINIGAYTERISHSNIIDASMYNISIIGSTDPISFTDIQVGAYTVTLLCTSSPDLSGLDIKWADGTEPVYSPNVDMVFLTTTDQGVSWYGSASLRYV